MEARKYEAITVSNVAIGFTAGLLTTGPLPVAVFISVEDPAAAGMRYRIDGTDPTAAEGHLLSGGDTLTIDTMGDLNDFRGVRVGGADITIRVTFFVQ